MAGTRKKLRVVVLYGGRSGEHEISLRSAASVIRHLDRERFEILPVAVDKEGRWHLNDLSRINASVDVLPVYKDAPRVVLPPESGSDDRGGAALVPWSGAGKAQAVAGGGAIDVVFPVMHGPLCEDGTIQGLLELADVPYVGCGVLASAVAMDKEVAKRLARDAGLPIVPYVSARKEQWQRELGGLGARVERELGFPVFVKPANLGSSVGVHKVKTEAMLGAALEDAFRYDLKVLIEKAVDAREIEVSILENPVSGEPPLASSPGEILPAHEFYSYEAKYIDESGATHRIPAELGEAQTREAQRMGRLAFTAFECEGMARVDLFLDRRTGGLLFNEMNTIPGFTSISMYPKMWEASGIPYRELLTRLIELAVARHERRSALVRDFHG